MMSEHQVKYLSSAKNAEQYKWLEHHPSLYECAHPAFGLVRPEPVNATGAAAEQVAHTSNPVAVRSRTLNEELQAKAFEEFCRNGPPPSSPIPRHVYLGGDDDDDVVIDVEALEEDSSSDDSSDDSDEESSDESSDEEEDDGRRGEEERGEAAAGEEHFVIHPRINWPVFDDARGLGVWDELFPPDDIFVNREDEAQGRLREDQLNRMEEALQRQQDIGPVPHRPRHQHCRRRQPRNPYLPRWQPREMRGARLRNDLHRFAGGQWNFPDVPPPQGIFRILYLERQLENPRRSRNQQLALDQALSRINQALDSVNDILLEP